MRALPLACLCALLGACAPMPDLGPASRATVAAGPYPGLKPMPELVAAAAQAGDAAALTASAGVTDARVAALKARAAALSAPVLPPDSVDRLNGALPTE